MPAGRRGLLGPGVLIAFLILQFARGGRIWFMIEQIVLAVGEAPQRPDVVRYAESLLVMAEDYLKTHTMGRIFDITAMLSWLIEDRELLVGFQRRIDAGFGPRDEDDVLGPPIVGLNNKVRPELATLSIVPADTSMPPLRIVLAEGRPFYLSGRMPFGVLCQDGAPDEDKISNLRSLIRFPGLTRISLEIGVNELQDPLLPDIWQRINRSLWGVNKGVMEMVLPGIEPEEDWTSIEKRIALMDHYRHNGKDIMVRNVFFGLDDDPERCANPKLKRLAQIAAGWSCRYDALEKVLQSLADNVPTFLCPEGEWVGEWLGELREVKYLLLISAYRLLKKGRVNNSQVVRLVSENERGMGILLKRLLPLSGYEDPNKSLVGRIAQSCLMGREGYYNTQTAVLGVIIDREGKILMVRKAHRADEAPKPWSFPGGTHDLHDASVNETLSRELQEELGLARVTIGTPPEESFVFTGEKQNESGGSSQLICIHKVFYTKRFTPNLKTASAAELVEAKWMSPEEILLNTDTYPNVKWMVKALIHI